MRTVHGMEICSVRILSSCQVNAPSPTLSRVRAPGSRPCLSLISPLLNHNHPLLHASHTAFSSVQPRASKPTLNLVTLRIPCPHSFHPLWGKLEIPHSLQQARLAGVLLTAPLSWFQRSPPACDSCRLRPYLCLPFSPQMSGRASLPEERPLPLGLQTAGGPAAPCPWRSQLFSASWTRV